MKARYVFETIEFERGRDPRKTMEIGRWAQIKRDYEKDQPWRGYSHEEALAWAASKGNKEYVEYLLANGVDPNYKDGEALSNAAGNNNIEILKILLNYRIDQDNLDRALEQRSLRLPTMKLLIDAGANITDELLESLIWHGRPETVEFIFSKGAKIKNQKNIQNTFAYRPDLQMLKVFLNNGLKLDKNDNEILRGAASHGEPETLKFLLDNGFKAKGELGGKALIEAVSTGNPEVIKLLIDAGADLNTIDEERSYYVERYSALTKAAESGNIEIVKMLLDAGADIHILNDKAHKIARKNGQTETLEFIKDYKKMLRQRAKENKKA